MSLPIYLIGARGCGKTTIGQALSQALGYAFRDTDHHLQITTQRTVAEIVAAEGWDSFRARESESLQAVTAPGTIIATGGGMVLAEVNRRFMREHGQVIWLNAPSTVLADRLVRQPEAAQRPTLTGRPIAEEMGDILRQRAHLYHQAAHHEVNAMQSPDLVVEAILQSLSLARAS
ncbi:MAG: shikimate kinase AroL [Pantoea sp.]|uniref:Shikimate kinase 1 n=1 Tax=Pantoea phytobeneficialis TaxID=2052056 RepID=A0AAP9KNA8_9GAMM|nr:MULTISPECIES: shikimate kinase AroL [Pantoea]ERK07840.1 Shikimate kinase III [Pantoea sp. AS-PWVM4]MDO6407357.1 shikimate kinase AroL [Pantoea phytobeneficialis]QGR05726.1 shikimate kinase AroL [Pantoea phytobeneficialis]